MTTVSVVGAGIWGTALALVAHRAGKKTTLYSRDKENAVAMQASRVNAKRLPSVVLPDELLITSDLQAAAKADIILIASPAQTVREVTQEISKLLNEETYFVICSKGIEVSTLSSMSEVVSETLPGHHISVLSGPSFAQEVAEQKPTAATLAANEIENSRWLSSSLSSQYFRLYPSDDLVGVEIAGALKNVLAIASGICTAKGFGESARSALITRGVAEVTRLGIAKGASAETFLGLSGVGDMILSCTSTQSRNMALGYALGQGISLEQYQSEGKTLTEGYFTSKTVLKLAEKYNIETPICSAIHDILHGNKAIDEVIEQLLSRPLKIESPT